ncbi:MAG: hypothetical protein WA017_05115 [Desulfosalsimonadaceae bacterium]
MNLTVAISEVGILPPASHISSEFLPTPRKPLDQGAFRIAGLGSFVTFLAHQEK